MELNFVGQFDNGHDFYDVEKFVDVNVETGRLSDEDIIKVYDALRNEHRLRRGKGKYGNLLSFAEYGDEDVLTDTTYWYEEDILPAQDRLEEL
ncbi:Uncharacterised protein [Streptococcus equi subsp. equi]|uniref:hypothetical protein n=1 Tax=Streptococcus equi TaxID=1336 RepID=UPI0006593478|nr:hypothetical protein [Streptococcus equi]UFR16923.1 hypothetical protein KVP03_02545 [Streptococcus equi subsp. zooepidemicus]WGS35425.1 hypothetical protein P1X07_01080 [Streptococcus equi]CRR07896.1 Uncharacterised protein [Streptococcus equi subsp. equi]CRR15660.1 Uncharacterised protein [Streptococcus equi subsp. equi]CRR21809.1 Uncharacterised protein [Streptococcus equi subsp. equi]